MSDLKTHILIIGGDGDLAIRKLYPALYSLDMAGELDDDTLITGLSRGGKNRDELMAKVKQRANEGAALNQDAWARFDKRLDLVTGDATAEDDMRSFGQRIDFSTTRLVVYLAIPPKVFHGVCQAMHVAGLVKPTTRVVVEKPLGTSCETFTEIHDHMAQIFSEEQVYRIDHYLGKESVQNLLALRFSNIMFNAVWNCDYIDHVQITVAETVGVEDRHEFYDEVGALRDMVQNHMLQILCLIALEPPATRRADMIRTEKLKVLQSLRPIGLEDISSKTVRGQYASGSVEGALVPGYQDEIGRERNSTTETFVAIKAEIDNWRWSGVPFYLRTGKRLSSRCAEIVVQFKKPKHSIFADQAVGLNGNRLTIRLQPDDGVHLSLVNKQPGVGELPLEELDLNLHVPDSRRLHSFDAYARLVLEVLRGDQTLFVSSDEVITSWKWIDQILENWNLAKAKAHPYAAGTNGPSQAVVMLARDQREWTELSR